MLYNIIKLHNNVAVGGALMSNPFHDAYTLIKNMAQNHYQLGSECTPVEKTQLRWGMFEVRNFDHMNAKVGTLYQKLDKLSITLVTTLASLTPQLRDLSSL